VSLAKPLREAIRELDANLPLGALRTMEEVRAASVAGPRFVLWLLSLFSGAALAIASWGWRWRWGGCCRGCSTR
jgi:hypothetical protein